MKVLAHCLVALGMCASSSAFVLAPSPVSLQRSGTAGVSVPKTGTRGGVGCCCRHYDARRSSCVLASAAPTLGSCHVLFCAQKTPDHPYLSLPPSVKNMMKKIESRAASLSLIPQSSFSSMLYTLFEISRSNSVLACCFALVFVLLIFLESHVLREVFPRPSAG